MLCNSTEVAGLDSLKCRTGRQITHLLQVTEAGGLLERNSDHLEGNWVVWEKRWQVGESSLSQHCPCCHGYPELACHKYHVGIYSLFLENRQHCPADLTTSALQSWQKLSNMHMHSSGHKLQKTSSWFRSSEISFFRLLHTLKTMWGNCKQASTTYRKSQIYLAANSHKIP
jgi:hypothetical protein